MRPKPPIFPRDTSLSRSADLIDLISLPRSPAIFSPVETEILDRSTPLIMLIYVAGSVSNENTTCYSSAFGADSQKNDDFKNFNPDLKNESAESSRGEFREGSVPEWDRDNGRSVKISVCSRINRLFARMYNVSRADVHADLASNKLNISQESFPLNR